MIMCLKSCQRSCDLFWVADKELKIWKPFSILISTRHAEIITILLSLPHVNRSALLTVILHHKGWLQSHSAEENWRLHVYTAASLSVWQQSALCSMTDWAQEIKSALASLPWKIFGKSPSSLTYIPLFKNLWHKVLVDAISFTKASSKRAHTSHYILFNRQTCRPRWRNT